MRKHHDDEPHRNQTILCNPGDHLFDSAEHLGGASAFQLLGIGYEVFEGAR